MCLLLWVLSGTSNLAIYLDLLPSFWNRIAHRPRVVVVCRKGREMQNYLSRWLLIVVFVLSTSIAVACPLCLAPGKTLCEEVSEADVVVLAEFTETIRKDPDAEATGVVYQLVEVLKGEWKSKRIELNRYEFGRPGDLLMLTGNRIEDSKSDPKAANPKATVKAATSSVEWLSPRAVSELAFRYVQQAPSTEVKGADRLKYFLKFLESSDPTIASDAYGEFAVAPYKQVVEIKELFPREKLRRWVIESQSKTAAPVKARSGLYAMMLGHCGDESDAKLLEGYLQHSDKEFPLGLDGIAAGYLLLKGEAGLQKIEEIYIKNRETSIVDLMVMRSALSFLWAYEPGRFSMPRLRAALRPMLDRPELTTDIIIDLARWEDWESQPKMIELLQNSNQEFVRRNAMGFLVLSANSASKSSSPKPHAKQAKEVVERYRRDEPKLVKEAEQVIRRGPRS